MDNITITTQYDIEDVISLWSNIFGEEEAEMERKQLDGSEADFNTDIVYVAVEKGRLVGSIHITIPTCNKKIAGLSGMCTIPEVRGKGVAKCLFAKAMKMLDESGTELAFLGTENPLAAHLYKDFGFFYLPGSRVMVNFIRDNGIKNISDLS